MKCSGHYPPTVVCAFYKIFVGRKATEITMIRIDTDNIKSLDEKKSIENRLNNRILLNVLYTLLAYIMLFISYRYISGFSGMRIDVIEPARRFMVCVLIVFLIAAAGLYIWSCLIKENENRKSNVRNHSYLLLGGAVLSFILNLTFYLKYLFPIESTSGVLRSIVNTFRNPRNDLVIVAVLIAASFIILSVYNILVYRKLSRITKKSLSKN